MKAAKQIVNLVKKYGLRTVYDFEDHGLMLKWRGRGSFRIVYTFRDNENILVKFPNSPSSAIHTVVEVRRIKALSKYRVMRQYLPKIYYSRGGLVVMENCGGVRVDPSNEAVPDGALLGCIQNLIRALTRIELTDLCGDNVRIKIRKHKRPAMKFVDLGY